MTTIYDPEGTISDGSFGYNYKNNSMCRWKIIPEGTGPLELTFTSFRTESENDVLRIYDLGSETLIATYSGIYTGSDVPPPVLAPSGKLFLIFSTNGTTNEAGWEADFLTYAVATEEKGVEPDLLIYPNPASGIVNLEIKGVLSKRLTVELREINGRLRHSSNFNVQEQLLQSEIDITDLPSGIYILRITGEDETITRKLVVRQ